MTDTAHRAARARVPGRLHALGRARDRALPHRAARRADRRRPPRRRPGARAADRVRPDDERGGRGRRRSLVEVGPRGTVQRGRGSPSRGRASTRSTKPFAFALIRPDGADTAMLHVVDCGTPDAITRRHARRAALARRAHRARHRHRGLGAARRRRGARARAAARARPRTSSPSPASPRRSGSSTSSTPGEATDALPRRPGRGQDHRRPRAVDSDEVYAASRGTDPTTGEPTSIEVEVAATPATITTFCVVNIPGLSELAPEIPYVSAQILLDGANNTVLRPDPRRRRSTRCTWACG